MVMIFAAGFFIQHQRTVTTPKPVKSSLEKAILSALQNSNGRYGVYIKNFKTKETYAINPHGHFEPGSLYKIWIMAAVYEKIKTGDLKEDDVLTDSVEDLNNIFDIPPDQAELTDGDITLSVHDGLEQMITISHNYAALLLTKEVGVQKVADFLKKYQLNESSVGDNLTTTPADIGKFYDQLYQGRIIDSQYSQKMLDLLSRQQINDRIPKNLPPSTKVAHKTGDIDFFENDGGIVFSPKGDYIIVVLSESDLPQAADDKIADISLAVYQYFNK